VWKFGGPDQPLVRKRRRRCRAARTVPAAITGSLRAHRDRQEAEWREAGRAWHDTDLVFCRRNGYPLNGSVVTHHFQKLLKKPGSLSGVFMTCAIAAQRSSSPRAYRRGL